jgi:hypothetical protein
VEVCFSGHSYDIQDTPYCPPVALPTPSQKRCLSLFHLPTIPDSAVFSSRQFFHAALVATLIICAKRRVNLLGLLVIASYTAPRASCTQADALNLRLFASLSYTFFKLFNSPIDSVFSMLQHEQRTPDDT